MDNSKWQYVVGSKGEYKNDFSLYNLFWVIPFFLFAVWFYVHFPQWLPLGIAGFLIGLLLPTNTKSK